MLIKSKQIENNYDKLYSIVDNKIGIPIFQRFYAWKEAQTRQLLEDILNATKNNKELYLLDFIYYIEDEKIMIADGQQRLVTINLLIKAINDTISINNLQIDQIKPFDISYDIIENNNKYHDSYYNYVKAPFKKVFLYLSEFINNNIDYLEKIKEIITERIYVYFKKCTSADEAFLIFQQINTGGKPLSKDEIIKTALDQYSKIYDIEIETLNIKSIRQDLISFYKYKEDNYSANFDNMTIMSFLKKYVTKDRDSFKYFKESVDKLDRLKGNPLGYIIQYINRPSLYDVMNVISMMNIDLRINKKYVNKVMLPLCLASITLSFKTGNPVIIKYLSTDLIKMIKEGKSVDELERYIAEYINRNSSALKITLEEFTEELGKQGTNYQNIKKALLIMDVMFRNTAGELNVESINLEHIYPQKPDTEWATKGWPTSHDEQQVLINNIGNYLLLNEEVNKRIKNKYIIHKIPEYNNIIPKDLMLQTVINTVDFQKFEELKEDYIFERQKEIAKQLRSGLPFGEALITR